MNLGRSLQNAGPSALRFSGRSSSERRDAVVARCTTAPRRSVDRSPWLPPRSTASLRRARGDARGPPVHCRAPAPSPAPSRDTPHRRRHRVRRADVAHRAARGRARGVPDRRAPRPRRRRLALRPARPARRSTSSTSPSAPTARRAETAIGGRSPAAVRHDRRRPRRVDVERPSTPRASPSARRRAPRASATLVGADDAFAALNLALTPGAARHRRRAPARRRSTARSCSRRAARGVSFPRVLVRLGDGALGADPRARAGADADARRGRRGVRRRRRGEPRGVHGAVPRRPGAWSVLRTRSSARARRVAMQAAGRASH